MQVFRPICRTLAVSALLVTLARAQSPVPPKSDEHSFAEEPYVVEQLRNSVRLEADGKGQRFLVNDKPSLDMVNPQPK